MRALVNDPVCEQYIQPNISSTSWSVVQWRGLIGESPLEFPIITLAGDMYIGVLEAEEDPRFSGYYNAYVVGLPGCVSYGEDIPTARANLRNALELYLTELQR